MGPNTLSARLGIGRGKAAELISAHKEAYSQYWAWRESLIDHLMTGGEYQTRFGWRRPAGTGTKSTSIGNFPAQAGGAEILRLAVIALEEAGHRVVATIHDALLVEMDEQGHEMELQAIRGLMKRAGAIVTGVAIRTDVDLVTPLRHFEDARGRQMWDSIGDLV